MKTRHSRLFLFSLLSGIPSLLLGQSVLDIRTTLYSAAMKKDVPVAIRLPAGYLLDKSNRYPVLYALHGAGAPYETWTVMATMHSAIASGHNMVVASFEAELSSYLDQPGNPNSQYTTFFFDEFVPWIEANYPVKPGPAWRAVTGFSMGGYGAFHYMMEDTGYFSSVSALSGAFHRSPNPFDQIETAANNHVALPPIYLGCGTDDRYLSDSQEMAALLTRLNYEFTYVETLNGGHDYVYWDSASDEIVEFHDAHFGESWHGYRINEGFVETGDFLGQLYVYDQHWAYSYALHNWLYLATDDVSQGGWVWVMRKAGE